MLLPIGLIVTAGFGLGMVWLALRAGAVGAYPAYGWWGLAALAGLEALLALRAPLAGTFFTALIWTAYIPAVDAAVRRRRGDSMLLHPIGFAAMAALSVAAWVVFELYNLRLRNWTYVGVPSRFWVFAPGAAWAFATIFPGIFETADLIHCGLTHRLRSRPWGSRSRWVGVAMACSGAALLLGPLLLPRAAAPYGFAAVWAGFIFLLDPLHRLHRWPSLGADLEVGRPGRFLALLLAGAACGFFWEFWNYWALARWQYVFPILPGWRIFAMPAPGFLGFPPFAIECFALYTLLAHGLLPPAWRLRLLPPP